MAGVLLVVEGPNGQIVQEIKPGTTIIGRAGDNGIVLLNDEVSRHHAELSTGEGGTFVKDLGSTNGTLLNGTRLKQLEPEPFRDQDCVQIGPFAIRFQTAAQPSSAGVPTPSPVVAAPAASTPPSAQPAGVLDLAGRTRIKIGRFQDNDIVVDHPQVSRHHAEVTQENGRLTITDLNSTNGTFVNGRRITGPTAFQDDDTIQIASYRFLVHSGQIQHFDDHGNISVDALHLVKKVAKGLEILTDVSIAVQPREFVAIVGGSGAGKTTLLDALNGFRPATSGAVLYNGANLYQNFDAYRNVIGYVPQDDIIHRELTVHGALSYAAQLRLPRDTDAEERKQRIGEVMQDLGLEKRRDTPIADLSGGQRKRVSIGVELLNKPSLLFLDEPTSGLDPSTETKMMRLLRDLADQGHTILLVTHVTSNVKLCDKVAVMAPGGRLAFYGPPNDALAYFQVRDFVDIYDQLDNSQPEQLQARYVQSAQYQTFVAQPLSVHAETAGKASHSGRVKPAFRRISAFRQFMILSARNLEILLRDRASLVLMLLIAPLLGLLDLATWKGNLFDTQSGNSAQAITMLFITALDCVLVGSLASMREIVKETEIYRRERMVGLGIVPYISSKVWLGIVLALYQALMFVLFKLLVIPSLPHDPASIAQLFITLTLATLSGMLMGLFVSAISPNQNVAPLLTILLLVPQIIFGGGILTVNTLPNGDLVSNATITKWSFDSLVTISQIGRDVASDSCWQVSTANADTTFHAQAEQDPAQILRSWQDTLTEDYKKHNCGCLGPNIFSACRFPGITSNYTAADKQAVESPEPLKPTQPGDPPAQPPSPPAAPASPGQQPQCSGLDPGCQQQLKAWQDRFTGWQSSMTAWTTQMDDWKNQVDNWQKQMDGYKQATNKYQNLINAWQDVYKAWKEKRDKAIGNAEALIRKTNDDYGQFFQMNLAQNWLAQGAIMAVFFGLIFFAQMYKDTSAR